VTDVAREMPVTTTRHASFAVAAAYRRLKKLRIYRGGSAGRVDATEGVNIADLSTHVRSASEKRKHARFVAIAPNSWQVLICDV
jgi:hypothetical protein